MAELPVRVISRRRHQELLEAEKAARLVPQLALAVHALLAEMKILRAGRAAR